MRHWLAALLLALGLALPALAQRPSLPPDSVYLLEARFTDQAGTPLDFFELRGQPRVVAMFYTSCQYICPLIIDSAKAVERNLGAEERARLGVALISMDPRRDTPEALAAVAARHRVDGSRWRLLRPRRADVRQLAGILGVRYRELADGEFNHTSALVLLDARGRVLARTEKMDSSRPDPEFLAAVRRALAQ